MNTCKAPVSTKHDARGALDNYTFKQKNDCDCSILLSKILCLAKILC